MNHTSLFPAETHQSEAEICARFARFHVTAAQDARLCHSLLLPTGYRLSPKPSSGQLRRTGWLPLSHFTSDHEDAYDVSIAYCDLSRDVNPGDWLQIALESEGASILDQRALDGTGGFWHDLLAMGSGETGARIGRHFIVRAGSRLFWLEASAPQAVFARVCDDGLISLLSLHLPYADRESWAEDRNSHAVEAPHGVRFEYPRSWHVFRSEYGARECVLELRTAIEDRELGRITVSTCEAGEHSDFLSLAMPYIDQVRQAGTFLNGAPVLPVEPPVGFHKAAMANLTGTFQGSGVSLGIALMAHQDIHVLISVLSPAKSESPEWWAINKRAFEIVRDSLRIGESPER